MILKIKGMKGIQYVKNDRGETTFLMVDYEIYGEAFLEYIQKQEMEVDLNAFQEGTKNEQRISFEEIRQMGLDKGIPESNLNSF